MNAQDLRKLLEQTDDKLSIFADPELFRKYNLNDTELYKLIGDFLNDEEKLKLFDNPLFSGLASKYKANIIKLVSDEKVLVQILCNDDVMRSFMSYDLFEMINELPDNVKQTLLYNQKFIDYYQNLSYHIKEMILKLPDDIRTKIVSDKDLITNRMQFDEWKIVELLSGISSDDSRINLLEKYELSKESSINVLKLLNTDDLCTFLEQHREFCNDKDILPYEIISALDVEKQKEFINKLNDINLSLNERKEILAALNPEVKQSIDTTDFPEEYKTALSVQTKKGRIVDIDFERNPKDYRGLDNLFWVSPEKYTDEQRTKLMKIFEICPNMRIINRLYGWAISDSPITEYKEAEEWITSIIDKLDPNYSQAQKLAVIDNEIGKKISYSPDFKTEVFDESDAKSLWKIISSGYGVCNGIARVEQYILDRVGIESEMIGSKTHSFLKIKGIELPLANGEIVKGDTILDPTWNLANHRFGGIPDNFCISYEQARKNDIDYEGKDHECHKNDEQLKDVVLNLDKESLTELFKSVGLADKDGKFPVDYLIDKSKQIDVMYANQPDLNIQKQFLLLKEVCPEFTTCMNSSMIALSGTLLNNENLEFNRCIVNRVYDREDKDKRPVMYVYIDSDEIGKKFYVPNNEGDFVEYPEEAFTKKYECYETDKEKNDRI